MTSRDVLQVAHDADLYARYEALLDLTSKARTRTTITDLAVCIAKGWRFCANVLRWRLIAKADAGFLSIDFDGVKTRISELMQDELPPAEKLLWDRHIPRRLRQNDIEALELKLTGPLQSADVSEVIVLPLDSEGRGLHFLALICSGPSGFSPVDLKFVEAVGHMFAGELSYIITANKLTHSLEQQANQDPLTGIPNRRHFERRMDLHWRDSVRRQQPLSLLMIDIDNFKRYNDHYGHLEGDNCLKSIARALAKAILRPMDFCARIGGEEFVVLLPDTPASGAAATGHRLIETVRNLAIEHVGNGDSKTASISIGASTVVPTKDHSAIALMETADRALYLAKNGGRDQLCQLAM